jgi:hypothetical protein
MKNKIVCVFVLSFFALCPYVLADTAPKDTAQEKAALEEKIIDQLSRGKLIKNTDYEKWIALANPDRPANQEDLLASMLAVPFEKRPYVFPMLHDSVFITKKVKTHPEIAAWRGKIPTQIPPFLQNWAKDNLAYLPSSYYIMIDPAGWYSKDAPPSIDPNTVNFNLRVVEPHAPDEEFANIYTYYDLPVDLKKNYKATDLSVQKLHNILQAVRALPQIYDSIEKKTDFSISVGLLAQLKGDYLARVIHPFQELFDNMNTLGYTAQLDKIAQKQGFKNAKELAVAADNLLKAYRASFLSPPEALYVQKLRHAKQPLGMSKENFDYLTYYAKLFEAKPGDVYFIEPYLMELKKEFSNPELKKYGLFLVLD